jgi:hypothetical protein
LLRPGEGFQCSVEGVIGNGELYTLRFPSERTTVYSTTFQLFDETGEERLLVAEVVKDGGEGDGSHE